MFFCNKATSRGSTAALKFTQEAPAKEFMNSELDTDRCFRRMVRT